MCLILNGYRDRAVWILWRYSGRFLYIVLDVGRSLQIKVDTTDELLASILDVAACVKKLKDQPRRTARDLRRRVAKCTEVDGGILGTFVVDCN